MLAMFGLSAFLVFVLMFMKGGPLLFLLKVVALRTFGNQFGPWMKSRA